MFNQDTYVIVFIQENVKAYFLFLERILEVSFWNSIKFLIALFIC